MCIWSVEIEVRFRGPSGLDSCPKFKKPLWRGHRVTVIFLRWHLCNISIGMEFMNVTSKNNLTWFDFVRSRGLVKYVIVKRSNYSI